MSRWEIILLRVGIFCVHETQRRNSSARISKISPAHVDVINFLSSAKNLWIFFVQLSNMGNWILSADFKIIVGAKIAQIIFARIFNWRKCLLSNQKTVFSCRRSFFKKQLSPTSHMLREVKRQFYDLICKDHFDVRFSWKCFYSIFLRRSK